MSKSMGPGVPLAGDVLYQTVKDIESATRPSNVVDDWFRLSVERPGYKRATAKSALLTFLLSLKSLQDEAEPGQEGWVQGGTDRNDLRAEIKAEITKYFGGGE